MTGSQPGEVKELRQMIDSGAPEEVEDWPHHLKAFFQQGAMYPVEGNVVLISNKVVMPTTLRSKVLEATSESRGPGPRRLCSGLA